MPCAKSVSRFFRGGYLSAFTNVFNLKIVQNITRNLKYGLKWIPVLTDHYSVLPFQGF